MKYPSVFRRYLSTLLDWLILWIVVYLLIRIPAVVNSDWRIAAIVVLLVLVYEPFLTAFRCTIGQWVFRLRVRSFHDKGRISVLQAYLRFLVKYFLGIVSLLMIPARPDRRAVHDFVTDTIVMEAAEARI